MYTGCQAGSALKFVVIAVLLGGFGAAGLEFAHLTINVPPFSQPMQAGSTRGRLALLLLLLTILVAVVVSLTVVRLMTERLILLDLVAMAEAVLVWLVLTTCRRLFAKPIPPPREG